MPDPCPRCLMAFPRHLVLRARCLKRWRGHNFDAAAAEGAVAAAVAHELGLSVRTTTDLGAFMRQAFVRAYGQGLDPNPAAEFDPAVGESFEFHVGLRSAMDDATFERIRLGAERALASARHFQLA